MRTDHAEFRALSAAVAGLVGSGALVCLRPAVPNPAELGFAQSLSYADPVDAIVLMVWGASLLMGLWLGVSGLICLASMALPGSAIARGRWPRAWVFPAMRPLLARTLAVAVASTSVGGFAAPAAAVEPFPRPTLAGSAPSWDLPAGSAPSESPSAPLSLAAVPPPTTKHEDGVTPTAAPYPVTESTERSQAVSPQMPAPAVTPAPTSDASEPSGDRPTATSEVHVVQPGDNLWDIATSRVSRSGGPSSTRAVAAYWLRLIDLNRLQLRSGDPDLIFPGEVIELPPFDEEPSS